MATSLVVETDKQSQSESVTPIKVVENLIQEAGVLDDLLCLSTKLAACDHLLQKQVDTGELNVDFGLAAHQNLLRLRMLFLRLAITTLDFGHWLETLTVLPRPASPPATRPKIEIINTGLGAVAPLGVSET